MIMRSLASNTGAHSAKPSAYNNSCTMGQHILKCCTYYAQPLGRYLTPIVVDTPVSLRHFDAAGPTSFSPDLSTICLTRFSRSPSHKDARVGQLG